MSITTCPICMGKIRSISKYQYDYLVGSCENNKTNNHSTYVTRYGGYEVSIHLGDINEVGNRIRLIVESTGDASFFDKIDAGGQPHEINSALSLEQKIEYLQNLLILK